MKKLLLDTHTLLWATGKSEELSAKAVKYLTKTECWFINVSRYTLVSKDSKMKFYKTDGLDCIW
jgi:PIN domain nuclease of toxin-antitoxin system